MTEREFINYWVKTDFSEYNEMDIREEFISSLLNILGYSKNTINNIIREKTLQLTQPFQRIGRKRIQIDYVPTIRLKSFWILEAKPGNVKEMDAGDILQAYLYASHPEIQAEYIVLCNGWNLEIYDVHQVKDWDVPFFTIGHTNCNSKFNELKQILSAKSMLAYRRKQLLQQIHNTFEVELDIDNLKSFVREFNAMQHPIELKINENVHELQRKEFVKEEEKRKEYLKHIDTEKLLGVMELSGPRTAELYLEYCHRIENSDLNERAVLLRKLMQRYWGRCHSEFKCDCLAILLYVVKNNIEIGENPFINEPKDMLCEVIRENLTYHKESSMQNALDYLDKLCYKFAYVATKQKKLMDCFSKIIEDKKMNMAIDELLVERPTVAKEMIPLINIFADYLWFYLSRENRVDDIWTNVRVLDFLLKDIGDLELAQYPDNDNDLLCYNLYGDKYDYLFRVSYLFLKNHQTVVGTLNLDEELKTIISLDEKSALEFMPKMPVQKDELTDNEKDTVLKKILMALFDTLECWRESK